MQQSIIHRYEKRIRKTHRVANQTELKLKKQQASLLHFKKELSRHLVKLGELSTSGNEHARKRLKNIKMKIVQIDKIVPYLEKYVSVNRQAEMQTIAVLKESCTMELQQHSHSTSAKDPPSTKSATTVDTVNVVVNNLSENNPSSFLQPDSSLVPQLDTCAEGSSTSHGIINENPYASLSEVRKEVANSCLKARSNYAELNFPPTQKTTAIRPPSVNYSEVRIIPNCKSMLGSSDNCRSTEMELENTSPHIQQLDPNFDMPFESHESEATLSPHDTTITPECAAYISDDLAEQTVTEISISDKVGESQEAGTSTLAVSSCDHPNIADISTSTKKNSAPPTPPPRIDSVQVRKHMSQCLVSPTPEQVDLSPSNTQVECSRPRNTKEAVNCTSNSEGLGTMEGVPSVMDRIKVLCV